MSLGQRLSHLLGLLRPVARKGLADWNLRYDHHVRAAVVAHEEKLVEIIILGYNAEENKPAPAGLAVHIDDDSQVIVEGEVKEDAGCYYMMEEQGQDFGMGELEAAADHLRETGGEELYKTILVDLQLPWVTTDLHSIINRAGWCISVSLTPPEHTWRYSIQTEPVDGGTLGESALRFGRWLRDVTGVAPVFEPGANELNGDLDGRLCDEFRAHGRFLLAAGRPAPFLHMHEEAERRFAKLKAGGALYIDQESYAALDEERQGLADEQLYNALYSGDLLDVARRYAQHEDESDSLSTFMLPL